MNVNCPIFVLDDSDYLIKKLINNHNLNNVKCILYEGGNVICELGLLDGRLYNILIHILKHILTNNNPQQQQESTPAQLEPLTRQSDDSSDETIVESIQDHTNSVTSDQINQQLSELNDEMNGISDQNDDHNAAKMSQVTNEVDTFNVADIKIEIVDDCDDLIMSDNHEICIQATSIKQECIEIESNKHSSCVTIEPFGNINDRSSATLSDDELYLNYNLKPCSVELRKLTTKEIDRLKRQVKSRRKDFEPVKIIGSRKRKRSNNNDNNNSKWESNCIYKPVIKNVELKPHKKKSKSKYKNKYSVEEIALNLFDKLIKNNELNKVIQSPM